MCHEYEAWWLRPEDVARRKAERPSPADIFQPKPEPEVAATSPRPEVKADEKELVPAE
jgi:hypothetical protein